MIKAIVGSGGKTTLLKKMAAEYRAQGKKVFVTTTTHMFVEEDTILTDDAETIIQVLCEKGYAMAGILEDNKIKALSRETYEQVCSHADVVLVEADGAKRLPLKYPSDTEPVIPKNADEIIVVCGLNALGQAAKDVCHRLELVKACLGIEENTIVTPTHVQKLITEGYLQPLREKYPEKKITVIPRHDDSLYQKVIASMLNLEADVSVIRKEWFFPQPRLIICGAGHVAAEVAAIASRLDFRIRVIDDRTEFANWERFPTADEVICDSYDNLKKYLEPGAYYVVVTPNHKEDKHCVSTILSSTYAYLGMIGSRKKVASTFQSLRTEGFSEEQIGTVHAPIGLPIGAVTPAEIAVSILSQIIQIKNQHCASSADRELLGVKESGVLCIITAKHGSTPRGVGGMMFVGKDRVIGSIGGSAAEYNAICRARENPTFGVQTYSFSHQDAMDLGMVCGGWIQILSIPI